MSATNFWASDPDAWDTETGKPGIMLFSSALQVWALQQPERVSVSQASEAFKVPPQAIVEAVEEHCWMLLVGTEDDFDKLYIEHDGE